MNKNLLALSFLLLSVGMQTVEAQSFPAGTFKLGLKTGLNFSIFTNRVGVFKKTDPAFDNSFLPFVRLGGLIGLTADQSVSDRVSLGAELLYNARGMAYRQKNDGVLIIGEQGREQAYNYYKYDIDYLEIPLKASYNFLSPSSDTWLSGYAGLAPGIAVVKKAVMDYPEANAGPWDGEPDQQMDLSNVNSFNISVLAGLQLGVYHWAAAGFYIDLRGSYALLPVFQKTNGDDFDTRMVTGTFGLGVKF